MSKPELEILAPEAAQIGKLSSGWKVLSNLGGEAAFVAVIKRDIEASERHGKLSLFLAVRIGLALIVVKDNLPHGELGVFIERHFGATTRRSLTNYMRVAGEFLTAAKLRDARHRLSDPSKVAPILEEQLELFGSPQAEKLNGVLKKLVTWAKGKTLQDIYRNLGKCEGSPPPKNFGNAGGATKRQLSVLKREGALKTLGEVELFMISEDWVFLHDDELARLDNLLGGFAGRVGQLVQERRVKQEKLDRARRAAKGGAPLP